MWKIEEVEKELKEYGLTIHDLEPGKDEPKWLRNWRQGKRLTTFEMSMKLQFLQGKKSEKERENENNSSIAITSNSNNAIENTSKDENKSASDNENSSADNSADESKNKSNSENEIDSDSQSNSDSPKDTDNEGVDIKDQDEEGDDEMEPELDPLEELFQDHPRKDDTHTYKGFYLEKNIVKIIDKKSKKGGKGMKSKIVNEALKIVFKQKGWME